MNRVSYVIRVKYIQLSCSKCGEMKYVMENQGSLLGEFLGSSEKEIEEFEKAHEHPIEFTVTTSGSFPSQG